MGGGGTTSELSDRARRRCISLTTLGRFYVIVPVCNYWEATEGFMKAVRFHEYGGPQVLKVETAPDPTPESGEVVIRVRACALNHLDLDLRDGSSRIPLDLPHISGLEIAGEVTAVGAGVNTYKPGDRVMPSFYMHCGHCEFCRDKRENLCANVQGFGISRPGGYAELVAAPVGSLLRIPDAMSFDQAAAGQIAFGTSFHMLISRARIKSGETVLVQAAGSGVGSAAVGIAVAAGCRVIATAGSEEKLRKAEGLGATHTINYRTEKFLERVLDLTQGRGVDVVFEHVGGEVFTDSVKALAKGGRLVTCGAHAGEVPNIDLIDLFRREATVIGSYTYTPFELRQVMLLMESGKLKPVIHKAFPLDQAAAAQDVLARREQFGKVILNP